jgi:hypothetical protein
MGSTTYFSVSPTRAVEDELGVTSGWATIVRKARGTETADYGGHLRWYILRYNQGPAAGKEYITLAIVTPDGYGTNVKVIDETVGPAYIDVPDVIWNNRPELVEGEHPYADEWRAKVEARRNSTVPAGELAIGDKAFIYGTVWSKVGTHHSSGDPLWIGVHQGRYYSRTRITGIKAKTRVYRAEQDIEVTVD